MIDYDVGSPPEKRFTMNKQCRSRPGTLRGT